ncbi:ATP-binding cassette domain-containing protein [Desulfosporosinus sp. BG]|uniref:ATP-binding cassette domain-containing protein n=1 Tax=Desulfosporosinus sp. BG TaxID=1633135 RepID=UPI0008563C3B|nr:ATP-binding cassette domain-containing protein [Desulfosporosinus sp. BG]ODA41909.1 hypothetical protein DSBG_1401 [Desulfosporosinus sp. BG]
MNIIIDFKHIKLSFGANEVLTDVSFEIKQGELVGLIGRNGTGKSTISKLIIGSLQPLNKGKSPYAKIPGLVS